jgi:ABC-2 type transport system ATP-binding protein
MIFFETRQVSKRYAHHLALDKVSISVPQQSIYGLLGPNGAGKTSLIRIINQITAPDEGQLFLKGRPLKPSDTSLIGYLPEERGLYKKMKVGEQALYLSQLKGISHSEAKKHLGEWFEKFEITAWWNRKVEELSKGMQQKIQFIVTVIHKPELLIFDEPFSGFDPINVNLLKDEILNLRNNGSTILFSTHNMASVEELCSHIALINSSRKVVEGSVGEVKKQHRTHTYSLKMNHLTKNPADFLPINFRLIEHKNDSDGIITINVQADGTEQANELIGIFAKHGEILGYNEMTPSMNDIFIKLVNQSKPNRNE